jgi:RND family efflux transporter MFP subunit
MSIRLQFARYLRPLGKIALGILFLAIVAVLMYWLAGGFKPKIQRNAATAAERPAHTGPVAVVKRLVLPRTEEAVGTVQPVHEMVVTARVAAKITELSLTAGQNVAKDDVLVRLDDRDMKARVDQLKAALSGSIATRDQAKVDRDRYAEAYSRGVATKLEFDQRDLAFKNSEADVTRATEAVNEAQAALEYAVIRAPFAGVVVDKRVNVGDTVMPGQILATLYDPTHMQLVASVREMLTQRLKVGQAIGVRMETIKTACAGTVSEIVPEAQSASRTFQVKVTGPCPPGIYSGMFGRIVIPLDTEEVLTIPAAAISHVGQLDLVDVVDKAHGGALERRIVRLGRTLDSDVEILSGLREGEQVALPANSPAATPAAKEGR